MRTLLTILLLSSFLQAQQSAAPKPKPPAYLSAEEAGEDFVIQGEYTGNLAGLAVGFQVSAKGKGEFEAIAFLGGLPGAGWNENRRSLQRIQGTREAGQKTVTFRHQKKASSQSMAAPQRSRRRESKPLSRKKHAPHRPLVPSRLPVPWCSSMAKA